MAPHLVRAQSASKDIRIHSFHYTQTHTYTQTQTLQIHAFEYGFLPIFVYIYTEIHRKPWKTDRERLLKWWGGAGQICKKTVGNQKDTYSSSLSS